MKTRIITVAMAMFTVMAFAQKREIRKAGNAVEDGEYQEAKDWLSQAKTELSGADEDEKAEFYLYKGQAYLGTGQNVPVEDLMVAAEAFKKAEEMGSEDAAAGIKGVSNALVNSAIADQNAQNYEAAAEKLYTSYQLNTQDTIYLYYAASNAVNAQNYDKALEYYLILNDLGYSGETTEYVATNKETGEEELMGSKAQMDLFIKSGNYTNPQVRKTEPKSGEIAKNIALIYVEKGQSEKALAALQDAKAANPHDIGLLQTEANVYYELGQKDKYREIMEEITAKTPDDPTVFYNLGVTSAEMGDTEKAIEYYRKALELDPTMTNARINMAFVILSKEEPLIKEMNSLGTSAEDNARYEELSNQRKQLFKDALPILLKVIENHPERIDAARTVMNIYYQIGETEKAEAMKAEIAAMEVKQ
ncbi:MAG TPA: tetratricopeptide repeat protein [Salinimicrobium sp.]|nr:tetratricopeptide repeat protein [Salinimicrobium sp.]